MQISLPSLGGSPVHFTHGEPIMKANFFGLNDSQLHTVVSASRYPSYCLHQGRIQDFVLGGAYRQGCRRRARHDRSACQAGLSAWPGRPDSHLTGRDPPTKGE